MFKELNSIIKDKKFKIILLDSSVNINNYDDIILIDNDKILIKKDKDIIKIIGKDLSIAKAVDKELLIKGIIYSVEMR